MSPTNTLINVGVKPLNDSSWDGVERRKKRLAENQGERKFKEVKVPTYVTQDSKLNASGFYPAGS